MVKAMLDHKPDLRDVTAVYARVDLAAIRGGFQEAAAKLIEVGKRSGAPKKPKKRMGFGMLHTAWVLARAAGVPGGGARPPARRETRPLQHAASGPMGKKPARRSGGTSDGP